MRNPPRLVLRWLYLASLAACASARPVFDMRPVNDGLLSPEWPELLRTRYLCETAVVGTSLEAVRTGHVVEQWEFQGMPPRGQPAVSANLYQTGSVYFEGPAPHLLRLVQ